MVRLLPCLETVDPQPYEQTPISSWASWGQTLWQALYSVKSYGILIALSLPLVPWNLASSYFLG